MRSTRQREAYGWAQTRPLLLEPLVMAAALIAIVFLPVLGWPLAASGAIRARRQGSALAVALYTVAFCLLLTWFVPLFVDVVNPR